MGPVRLCSVRRRGVGRSNVVAVKRRKSGFPSAAANCAPSLRGRETATPQSNQRDPTARQRDTHSHHSECVNVTHVQPPSCSPNRGRKKSGPPCSAAHVSAFSAARARATRWNTMDDSISHVCSSDAQKVSKQAGEGRGREGVEGPDREGRSITLDQVVVSRSPERGSFSASLIQDRGPAEPWERRAEGRKREIIYKAEGKSVGHRTRRKRRNVI